MGEINAYTILVGKPEGGGSHVGCGRIVLIGCGQEL
jgi:hypothetical protein